jgi:hypothetical protein
LASGPFAQIFLNAAGASTVVSSTHYATLFLPGIFLAATHGAVAVRARFSDHRMAAWLAVAALTYCFFALSPLPKAIAHTFSPDTRARTEELRSVVRLIPARASVAASYRLMSVLSQREELYALHYGFLGTTQFAAQPYALPDHLQFIALDLDDLPTYRNQFTHTTPTAPRYDGGFERLARLFVGRPLCAVGQSIVAGPVGATAVAGCTDKGTEGVNVGANDTDRRISLVSAEQFRQLANSEADGWLVLDAWLGTTRQAFPHGN